MLQGLKFSATLPLFTNEGYGQRALVDVIVKEIATIAGGVSTQEIIGQWFDADSDTWFVDKSILAYTIVERGTKLDELCERAKAWCLALHQIELLITVEPIDYQFIKGV